MKKKGLVKIDKPTEVAIKFDSGKSRYTLMPWLAIEEVAKVFTKGGLKYGEYNYSLEKNPSRYLDAAFRHMQQYLTKKDEKDIDEIGTHHLANATASILMALDIILNKTSDETRNKAYKS